GAAGIVGLLKTALSLEHGLIPPSLNFESAGEAIPLEQMNLRVQQALGPWPRADRPRLAGVSSFGVGGTNCHVVLSSWDAPSRRVPEAEQPAAVLPWIVSGHSEEALRGQAQRLRDFVAAEPNLSVTDIGRALATSRAT